MNNKSILTMIGCAIISIGVIISTVFYYANNHDKVQTARTQALNVYDKLTAVKSKDIVYQVDSNKTYSTYTLKVIKNISELMTKMTTYQSGKQYQNNRADLQKVITDKSFFDKYYKSAINEDNENVINILNLKSITKEVKTYNLTNGQFLVIVSYIQYHNASDLNHEDQLNKTYQGYIMSANLTQITEVTPIDELSVSQQ